MKLWLLLGLEWKKYAPNWTFRVVALLYAGSFALILYLARASGHHMTFSTGRTTSHPLEGLFEYPKNWQVLACIGSWLNIFLLGVFGISMVTMELSNRTLRQSLIFGLTRLEIALSKGVWLVAIALASTGVYILLAIFEGHLDGISGPPLFGSILSYFLQSLGYLLLGTLFGILIRQSAMATVAYVAYVFVFETAFRWIFYFSVAKTRLLLFLPNHSLGALTPLPIPEAVNHIVQTGLGNPLSSLEAELASLAYIALFAALICRRLMKADL